MKELAHKSSVTIAYVDDGPAAAAVSRGLLKIGSAEMLAPKCLPVVVAEGAAGQILKSALLWACKGTSKTCASPIGTVLSRSKTPSMP